MAGESEETIYWDACVFLTYLMDESRTDYNPTDLNAWIEAFDKGEAKLVTSVITRVEILDVDADQQGKQRFLDAFVPPRAQMIQVTPPIATLAHEIRNHTKPQDEPTLSTPDAIHLATALIYDAGQFHTSDRGKSGDSRGLLSLDLSPLGYDLTPSLPDREQHELDV